eukprot:jgi/Psemu1/21323/gm1.21323_g
MSRIAFAGRDTRKRPSAGLPRKELTAGMAYALSGAIPSAVFGCGVGVFERNDRKTGAGVGEKNYPSVGEIIAVL